MRPVLISVVLSLFSFCAFAQQAVKISRTQTSAELPFDPSLKPFYHGVASGDPLENQLIIWTRVTPENENDIPVKWQVASDTGMTQIVAMGDTTAIAARDFTVKVDVKGLQPSQAYYYQFEALGQTSIIGRGKTTPAADNADSTLKFAVVSCANYEGGLFNAFERISERNDLDAVLHLGDYIYEYEPGRYKNAGLAEANRINIPNNEIITLADYRTRYSLYRLDHDLMKAHQQQTFITIWDDHESANDSYFDGAENHTDSTEGDWFERKAIAKKVYYEWMPIRDTTENTKLYRKISYGNLADLIMLDTRLEGREKPPVNFDDPDTGRKIISQEQYDWFINNLKTSTATWKVIGNQLLFSTFNVGFGAPSEAITNIDSIRTVENNFIDNWESYPLQRNSIIDSLRDNDIKNVVIVSGDSHCSWAFDVTKNARLYPLPQAFNIPQKNPYHPVLNRDGYNDTTGAGSWAVEFGTPSIASQNFDELGFSAAEIGQFEFVINNYVPFPVVGLVNYNPHLKYVDLKNHGYFILDLNKERARADYFYVPTVTSKAPGEFFAKGIDVNEGATHIASVNANAPAEPKERQDIPAPGKKLVTNLKKDIKPVIFQVYPNPAKDYFLLHHGILKDDVQSVKITNLQGRTVKTFSKSFAIAGLYEMEYYVGDLQTGTYFVVVETKKGGKAMSKLIKE